MVKPFKLLRLPPDALRAVCVRMENMDLLELSFCSKKTIGSLRILAISPKSYSIKYTREVRLIKIEFENGNSVGWRFESNSNINDIVKRRKINKEINVKFQKSTALITVFPSKVWSEQLIMMTVFCHFFYLFRAPVSLIKLEIFPADSPCNEFTRDLAGQEMFCENMEILGFPDIPHISLALENIFVTKKLKLTPMLPILYPLPQVGDDAKSLREKIQNSITWGKNTGKAVKRIMKSSIGLVDSPCVFELIMHFGASKLKNLSVPQLIINNASWVTPESFLRINSKYTRLVGSSFGLYEIRSFIEAFYNSKTKRNVEWIHVDVARDFSRTELLDGYATKPWDPETRDGHFSYFNGDTLLDVDLRDGFDIENSDGLLATILFVPLRAQATSQLHFVIWKTRFPNAENILKAQELLAKLEQRDEKNLQKTESNGHQILENTRKIESLNAEITHMELENKEDLQVNMRELDDYTSTMNKLKETRNKQRLDL